jgi:hypothetical protein
MRFKIGLILITLMSNISSFSQCGFNNTYYETIAAPTDLGASVTTLLYGGEFTTVTGMVPGNVYEVTTCGETAFDSQLTIYNGDGSALRAFNDDYITCTPQSKIYFSPFSSDNYNILLDEYNCEDNFDNYMTVTIKLFGSPNPIITIPVVVHVVYNGASQNISDSQIQSQINVLNEDFRRLNPDIFNSPSRFRGFSKDARIEFCLASRDPNGQPTNGITRTSTNHAPFSSGSIDMKYTAFGGRDIWDRDNYLNIWVCALEGTLLGFANFPGTGTADIDGVVVDYDDFGTIGTVSSPTHLGRTTTHEIGHWLDLYHVFQDGCSGLGDEVNDTPFQEDPNYGCPSGSIPVSCNNGGFGGDMYTNFMDYVDDNCMNMFTYLQNRRMRDALNGPRSSLITSNGCETTGLYELDQIDALISVYPNPSSSGFVSIRINLEEDYLQNSKLIIYDLLGKEITTINNCTGELILNVEEYNSGVYFYKLRLISGETGGGKFVIK